MDHVISANTKLLCNAVSLSSWLVLLIAPEFARAAPLLAYAKNGAIYLSSAPDGKNAKKIGVGDDPCISNDGRFLVYTRTSQPPAGSKHPRGDGGPGTRVIVLCELATGKETLLPSGGAQQAYGALWSPDDDWIAFNALIGKNWEVAAVHPDGTAFRVLTAQGDLKGEEYSLAGWNLHDKAILAQNLAVMVQIDPETSKVAWQRPVKELTGEEEPAGALRCAISADGKFLLATRYVETDEFKNLDGPSSYLVLADFPGGAPRRVTPPKFDASEPWLDRGGGFVLLRGFGERDVTTTGSEGLKLKTRIYRCELPSGKLTPLIEGGSSPTTDLATIKWTRGCATTEH